MFLPHGDIGESQKTSSDRDTESGEQANLEGSQSEDNITSLASSSTSASLPTGSSATRPADIALVAVSGSADFEAVRGWCDTVSQVRVSLLPYHHH